MQSLCKTILTLDELKEAGYPTQCSLAAHSVIKVFTEQEYKSGSFINDPVLQANDRTVEEFSDDEDSDDDIANAGARRLADWYPLHANDYWHVQYDAMDWEQNKDTCCKDCLKDYWRLFWAYTKYLPAIEWRWVQHPSKDKKVLRPVAVQVLHIRRMFVRDDPFMFKSALFSFLKLILKAGLMPGEHDHEAYFGPARFQTCQYPVRIDGKLLIDILREKRGRREDEIVWIETPVVVDVPVADAVPQREEEEEEKEHVVLPPAAEDSDPEGGDFICGKRFREMMKLEAKKLGEEEKKKKRENKANLKKKIRDTVGSSFSDISDDPEE